MTPPIFVQNVYLDVKDRPTGPGQRKAKIAGRPLPLLDLYGFFEVTSGRYVREVRRVDIERTHFEDMKAKYLRSKEGCIKVEPEFMHLADIETKRRDPLNLFPHIGRLCNEKWAELQKQVQDSKQRTGNQPWDVTKQSLIIQLTTAPSDVNATLKSLRLI